MKEIKQLIHVSDYRPSRGPMSILYEMIEEDKTREEILAEFQKKEGGIFMSIKLVAG